LVFLPITQNKVHQLLFDNFYSEGNALEIPIKKETIKVLVSNTLFNVGEDSFKLKSNTGYKICTSKLNSN